MRGIRIRTIMIAVALLALLMGLVGTGRRCYRRWSYHRSQAAWCWGIEQQELLRAEQEQLLWTKREAIRETLMKSRDFAARSQADQEKIINATVRFHQSLSEQARLSAERWEERRQMEETATWWCWDPYAPDVP